VSAKSDAKKPGDRRDRRRDRRRRRGRRAAGESAGTHAQSVAALQAEVVLLREENARLKADGLHQPDLDALLGRARSMARAASPEDAADDATQVLVDAMVLRESLIALCQEIARSMEHVEARLAALGDGVDNTTERS
jgi:uncharacterized small protein (DUF1192 family)